MKSIFLFFLFVFISSLISLIIVGADGILTNDNSNFISVHEVKMWIGNNGMGSHNPVTDGFVATKKMVLLK